MRITAAAALLSLVAMPVSPQEKLVETIEVRVANVDVVVRDRAGNPVTGLTKDDFEIYEDGVKQTITNLYEVRRGDDTALPAGVATDDVPVEVRQRRMVIFIDSASLESTRKASILASVQKFVDEQMHPEDQAMLVSSRLGLRVITPFTNDKAQLKKGIASLSKIAPVGDTQIAAIQQIKGDIQRLVRGAQDSFMEFNEAYSQAKTLVDRHANKIIMQQTQTLESIDRVLSTVAGFDGKKIMVIVSDHLPMRPGAELYRYVDDQFGPFIGIQNTLDLQSIGGVSGNRMPDEIDEIAKEANANNVTVYAIVTSQTDTEFSSEYNGGADSNEAYSRVSNTASALHNIAKYTGGITVAHTPNFDIAFDTIRRDLDSYYSLGYKPPEGPPGARKIRVKVKGSGHFARARETFVVRSADMQMDDRVIANLYAVNTASAWPIAVQTGVPRLENGGKYLIPIRVVIPSTLTLLPQEDKLVGGFVVYLAIGTNDGRTSGVMRRPQSLKIPPTTEWAVRAKPMTYSTAIRVNPGESTLSVAILDQVSGSTGFARANIKAFGAPSFVEPIANNQ
jgi:VWFA-related protein